MNRDTWSIIIEYLPLQMIPTICCVQPVDPWVIMLKRDYPSATMTIDPRSVYIMYREFLGFLDLPELDPFKVYNYCLSFIVYQQQIHNESVIISIKALRLLVSLGFPIIDMELFPIIGVQNIRNAFGISHVSPHTYFNGLISHKSTRENGFRTILRQTETQLVVIRNGKLRVVNEYFDIDTLSEVADEWIQFPMGDYKDFCKYRRAVREILNSLQF